MFCWLLGVARLLLGFRYRPLSSGLLLQAELPSGPLVCPPRPVVARSSVVEAAHMPVPLSLVGLSCVRKCCSRCPCWLWGCSTSHRRPSCLTSLGLPVGVRSVRSEGCRLLAWLRGRMFLSEVWSRRSGNSCSWAGLFSHSSVSGRSAAVSAGFPGYCLARPSS